MGTSKTIRGFFLLVGLFSAIAFLSPGTALAEGCAERCGNGDRKSLFCHVPQGNPENVQEICIADSSVPKHLEEHEGDHCGACEFTCEAVTCCEEQTPTEVAELSLQGGRLVIEDTDGNEGNLCCIPDNDGDGQCGGGDLCPNDPLKTAPGTCGCGNSDVDSDEDGTADCNDDCVNDSGKTNPGVCGCGVSDADSDSDSVPDCNDVCPGENDADTDGDEVLDCNDACPDDANKTTSAGVCGCGVADDDSDSDGTADCNDNCVNDPAKTSPGICGCGTSDVDTDTNGIADCNDNGGNDAGELASFPDTPATPAGVDNGGGGGGGKGAGVSFGGGFCQLLKTDVMEPSASSSAWAWALIFGITTLLLRTLRPTPALRSPSK